MCIASVVCTRWQARPGSAFHVPGRHGCGCGMAAADGTVLAGAQSAPAIHGALHGRCKLSSMNTLHVIRSSVQGVKASILELERKMNKAFPHAKWGNK